MAQGLLFFFSFFPFLPSPFPSRLRGDTNRKDIIGSEDSFFSFSFFFLLPSRDALTIS